MSQIVLLDAGPLGLVTNPRYSEQSLACAQWLQTLVEQGSRVIIPEIADYEVRRELIRARKARGLARLDALAGLLEYLPITTNAMRQAAVFWAQARQQGRPTADGGRSPVRSVNSLKTQGFAFGACRIELQNREIACRARIASPERHSFRSSPISAPK